jgi:DNA-binding NarL/FixJ family response regulator
MRTGWLLSRDLLFTSKVTGTAQVLGAAMAVVGSQNGARQRAETGAPGLILVDLAGGDLADPGFLRELIGLVPGAHVVAFGSHVDTAALKRAAEAGCHEVMPRSKFVNVLPELIRSYLVEGDPGATPS